MRLEVFDAEPSGDTIRAVQRAVRALETRMQVYIVSGHRALYLLMAEEVEDGRIPVPDVDTIIEVKTHADGFAGPTHRILIQSGIKLKLKESE